MKASASVLSLLSVLMFVKSETISCKVVPFETKDGLTGTCCVIFNKENQKFPKEEIAQQIITNSKEEPPTTIRNLPQEHQKINNVDTTSSPSTSAAPTVSSTTDETVVFVDGNRRSYNNPKEWKPKPKNVTISTKNAFDAPNGCPPGLMKDHSGVCTEPF